MPCTTENRFLSLDIASPAGPGIGALPRIVCTDGTKLPDARTLRVASMLRSLIATIGVSAYQQKNVFSGVPADIDAAPPHFH
jgi:hypothetical protein